MKAKRKGSIFIEFLAVLPTFFLVGWGTMQIMFYTMSQATMHQATMDAARVAAVELRGKQGKITTLEESRINDIKEKISSRMQKATSFNSLILLYKNHDGTPADDLVFVLENESACEAALLDAAVEKRVICLYTVETDPGGAVSVKQEQLIVVSKAPFYVMGNFIPGLNGKLFVRGFGAAEKEQANRFQYIN